jgi:hypothetical protein
MVARLSNVLYWVGCIVAALIVALFQVLAFQEPQYEWGMAISGLAPWLIGRALRYILAGT